MVKISDKKLAEILGQDGYEVIDDDTIKPEYIQVGREILITNVPSESPLEQRFETYYIMKGGKEEDYKRSKDTIGWDVEGSRMHLDFYFPEINVAVEINGGDYSKDDYGRRFSAHNSPEGLARDFRKLRKAHVSGIRLFFINSHMLNIDPTNDTFKIIDMILKELEMIRSDTKPIK